MFWQLMYKPVSFVVLVWLVIWQILTAFHCLCAAGVVDVCLIPEIPFKMEKLCAYVAEVSGDATPAHGASRSPEGFAAAAFMHLNTCFMRLCRCSRRRGTV